MPNLRAITPAIIQLHDRCRNSLHPSGANEFLSACFAVVKNQLTDERVIPSGCIETAECLFVAVDVVHIPGCRCCCSDRLPYVLAEVIGDSSTGYFLNHESQHLRIYAAVVSLGIWCFKHHAIVGHEPVHICRGVHLGDSNAPAHRAIGIVISNTHSSFHVQQTLNRDLVEGCTRFPLWEE